MRVRSFVLAAVVAAAIPAVGMAQDTQQPAPAKPAKEKKICRRGAPETGSIVPAHPVCHTKDEWAQIDGQNARNADQLLNGHPLGSGPSR